MGRSTLGKRALERYVEARLTTRDAKELEALNYAVYECLRAAAYEAAEKAARRLVEIDGNSPFYLDTLAEVMHLRGERAQAVQLSQKALALIDKEREKPAAAPLSPAIRDAKALRGVLLKTKPATCAGRASCRLSSWPKMKSCRLGSALRRAPEVVRAAAAGSTTQALQLTPQERSQDDEQHRVDRRREANAGSPVRAIDRPHRHVHDSQTRDGEPGQKIVGIAIAGIQAIEVDGAQRSLGHGGVAALRVEDLPVARRGAAEQGEDDIAEQAQPGHGAQDLGVGEAVAFAVVGVAVDDRAQQGRQIRGIHLAVTGHHHRDIAAALQRQAIAAADRRSDAAVVRVTQDVQVGTPAAPRPLGGGIGAGVIDHDHQIDVVGDPGKRRGDAVGFVVGGDNDG